ncbi:hypothetical protein ELI_0979 [Eubacterium callanderi]|uniref:Uncharacterized protein n=1 Tax=Eubacterium callanderi TaxID=53442 RepID=E3GKH5_9FIRM|nr:hypothetical protein ELI_0979 [Eubacterium callanderi]
MLILSKSLRKKILKKAKKRLTTACEMLYHKQAVKDGR